MERDDQIRSDSFDSADVDEECCDLDTTQSIDIKKNMEKLSLDGKKSSLVDMNYTNHRVYKTICHVCFKILLTTSVGEHINIAHPTFNGNTLSWNLFVFLKQHQLPPDSSISDFKLFELEKLFLKRIGNIQRLIVNKET